MVSFAYFHKVNIYLLQSIHTPLLEKFLVTWASFSRHQTNFGPAQQFDRTLGPHETVQYFLSVHTGLWRARRLNFIRLAWFHVNGKPERTNFQSVENSSSAVERSLRFSILWYDWLKIRTTLSRPIRVKSQPRLECACFPALGAGHVTSFNMIGSLPCQACCDWLLFSFWFGDS